MAGSYSWERGDGERGYGFSLGYGFWVLLSTIAGVGLFVLLLMGLDKMSLWLGLAKPIEIRTGEFRVEQIEVSAEPLPEVEEEIVVPEETDASELLTEIEELIPELDDVELDLSPEIEQPELALEASIPLDSGEEFGELFEPVAAPEVSHVLDQIGRTENLFEEAATGQVIIEEGSVKADVVDPDEYLKDMAKKGSGGLSDEGLPTGYASIDGLLRMASGELTRSRAALPSDLLFDYDSAELKEKARLGLMKLAMLIDRNPEMYCILEGHTDLFGEAGYNLDLSERRAEAVRGWLMEAMRLDGEQIVVRGYGMQRPKVEEGTIEEQALNRRVDILMRKEIPPEVEVLKVVEERVEEEKEPVRALPVEEEPVPLKALPVE
ncbi:MAG: OmpA family protein [Verrucomicrobiota bacterium]